MNVASKRVARHSAGTWSSAGALLATLALGACHHAVAAEPAVAPSRPPVIAQSTVATAATGRIAISSRIARARRPIQVMPAASPAVDNALAAPDRSDTPPAAVAASGTPDPTKDAAAGPRVEGFTYPMSVADGLPTTSEHESSGRASSAPAVSLRVLEPMAKISEGSPIEWRLQLANTGSEPLEGVTAWLFFAEGIEPVAASGSEAALAAWEVRFAPLASLGPGETVELLVTGVSTAAGEVAYRAEVIAAGSNDPVAEEGFVRVTAR